MLGTGGEESGNNAAFERVLFDRGIVLTAVEDVGGGGLSCFFTHDHDGDRAT